MPIPRYSSSTVLNHSQEGSRRGSERDGSMYSSDRHSGFYRSSPDLTHSGLSKRRSSSTDSTDGSHGGGHSRQSSDSVEYPTRRYSVQSSGRKTSVSADPLQFIKVKEATNLALHAEEQMRLAAETKKLKITESISEDDSTEWQSNLASWKNRRKSQSEKSYQLKEELEQMEREKEETEVSASQATKTFSQMQEERQRRKSAGKKFYPIGDEDEGEDDIFSSTSAAPQYSSPSSRDTKPKIKSKENVAKLAQDSGSENENDVDAEEMVNNHKKPISTPETRTSRFSRDRDTESSLTRLRRSELPEYTSHEKRDSWQRSHTDTKRDSAFKENNRNSANSSSLSSRSSGKISNILKNFEQAEENGAKPKVGVNSSVDVGARKKSFESFGARSGGVASSYHSWSTDRGNVPSRSSVKSEITSHQSSAVYAVSRNSGKDYVEKHIKISLQHNSAKGFGFTLSGGADKKQPVIVQKVGLGSAADVCELQAKDEVMSINGQSVARMTSVELTQLVDNSARSGQIELRVKRFLGSGDEFDEEEDFLSTDEEVDTPERSASKSSSVRAENSFDSLDSRDGPQKAEEEQLPPVNPIQSKRRGDPTSTSSDSGYDAQTFSPYHRGDNSSNEDEIIPSQQQQSESQKRPSLAARTRHLYPRDEDEDDYVNLQAPSPVPAKEDYSGKDAGKETGQTEEVEVVSRPSITVRRERTEVSQKRNEEEEGGGRKATFESSYKLSSARREEKHSEQMNSEDSDSGPPAALFKWQQKRSRRDYTFESDEPEPTKFYDQMKLSSSITRHDSSQEESLSNKSHEEPEDTERTAAPVVSTRRTFNIGEDRRRMYTWNQQQEEERQSSDQPPSDRTETSVEMTQTQSQQRFNAERDQIQQKYQHDLQKAAESERHKQEQEKQILEPEMEKMRLLEERRAQRKARLEMYSQDLNAELPPPSSSSRSSAAKSAPENSCIGDSRQQQQPQQQEQQPQYQQQQQQQHSSSYTTQIQGGRSNVGGQSEVLVIDPRNRGGEAGETIQISQPGQPMQFQLKINSRETPQGLLIQPEVIPSQQSVPPPIDHAAFLEAERERIRQEELQRIEAERQQREEEERRHIRSKEEQLRQQEEMLRQQQEELRKNQERLEQERQQLQQHQQFAVSKPQQPEYSQSSAQESLQFETVTSKVRRGSPAYTSTIVSGPRRSDARPEPSQSYADSNRSYQDGHGARRSEAPWNSSRSWKGNSQPVSSNQNPRWAPGGGEHGQSGSSVSQAPGLYSREDMVAMNRKATPLHGKPSSPSPSSPPAEHPEASSPIRREAPSKDQIRSLNSVPRAKFRSSEQWMSEDMSGPRDVNNSMGDRDGRTQPPPPRRSDAYRSQFAGPQDHWLVQEAERRRMNESGHSQAPSRAQFSGPIKPATDNIGNRWRGEGNDTRRSPNMPAQIRQTLLQKTAGARGSTASNSSQEMNLSDSSSSLSHTLPPNFGYGGGYPNSRTDPMPPQHRAPSPVSARENGVNISGKQHCSHCSQELGFGAAMVIESLGLYYHTQCFKCCVCRTPLGNGVEGADVRVRVNKLHCPNCYSNDEAGLKFSKV